MSKVQTSFPKKHSTFNQPASVSPSWRAAAAKRSSPSQFPSCASCPCRTPSSPSSSGSSGKPSCAWPASPRWTFCRSSCRRQAVFVRQTRLAPPIQRAAENQTNNKVLSWLFTKMLVILRSYTRLSKAMLSTILYYTILYWERVRKARVTL